MVRAQGVEKVETTVSRREQQRSGDGVREFFVAGLLFVLSMILSTIAIGAQSELTPIDEQTHIDYAWEVSHGRLPRAGEPMSSEVLNMWSCAGQDGAALPACGSGSPASNYPGDGENYNFWQPPLYFVVVGPVARAVAALDGSIGFIGALRWLGAGISALGLVALFGELRKWNVPIGAAGAGSLLLMVLPPVVSASSRVTPDSAITLCSVAALVVLRRVLVEHRMEIWSPVLLTLLVAGVKVLNALPLLAAAVCLLLLGLWNEPNSVRARRALCAISIPLSVAVVHLGWNWYQGKHTPAGYVNPVDGVNTRVVTGNPAAEWLSTVFSGSSMVSIYYFPDSVNAWTMALWVSIISPVIAALAIAGWLMVDRTDKSVAVGVCLLIGILAWPLAVQVQAWSTGHMYFPVMNARYGAPFLPIAAACGSMVATRRNVVPLFQGLATGGLVLVVLALLGVGLS